MKMKNRVISVMLSVVIILLNIIPSFATKSSMDTLLDYGIAQSFLESIPNVMVERIINQIGSDEEISNVYRKVMFLYDETDNVVQPYGMISESSLALDIEAIEICLKNTSIVSKVLIAISWDWAGVKPFQRWQDAMTVNWDSNLFVFSEDSFYSVDSGKVEEEDEWIAEFEYTRPSYREQGGLGFYSNLSAFYQRIAGAATFLLIPRISMVSGTSKITEINVNYVHDRSFLFPLNISFNTSGLQVCFDINRNSYDEAADTANYRYSLG